MKIELKYPYLTSLILSFVIVIGSFFLYHYQQKGSILSLYSQLNPVPKPVTRKLPSKSNQEYIRILSIEGGGIYGILPAHILEYIENKTGKHISELFDLMVGTSTGALETVLLTVPGKKGKPRYTAKDVLNIYNNESKFIFYSPWYHRILTLNGLLGPKYTTASRYQVFKKFLGDIYFDDLVNNVVIPAYGIEERSPLLFANWLQKGVDDTNFSVTDLLMGAVSPPGMFPSVVFGSGSKRFILADGAVFANNPSLAAVLVAMSVYPNKQYILVTLGTGSVKNFITGSREIVDWGDLQWSESIFPVILDGTAKFNNILLKRTFPFPLDIYYFNTEVSDFKNEIDNIAQWNIERLNREGERMLSENKNKIDELIPRLLRP